MVWSYDHISNIFTKVEDKNLKELLIINPHKLNRSPKLLPITLWHLFRRNKVQDKQNILRMYMNILLVTMNIDYTILRDKKRKTGRNKIRPIKLSYIKSFGEFSVKIVLSLILRISFRGCMGYAVTIWAKEQKKLQMR